RNELAVHSISSRREARKRIAPLSSLVVQKRERIGASGFHRAGEGRPYKTSIPHLAAPALPPEGRMVRITGPTINVRWSTASSPCGTGRRRSKAGHAPA